MNQLVKDLLSSLKITDSGHFTLRENMYLYLELSIEIEAFPHAVTMVMWL